MSARCDEQEAKPQYSTPAKLKPDDPASQRCRGSGVPSLQDSGELSLDQPAREAGNPDQQVKSGSLGRG